MAFGHEQLDVYRAAIEDVGRAYCFDAALAGHRNAKDQLLRASPAIPLTIAEGNGKGTDGSDRPRYRYRPRRRWEHRTGISPTARAQATRNSSRLTLIDSLSGTSGGSGDSFRRLAGFK